MKTLKGSKDSIARTEAEIADLGFKNIELKPKLFRKVHVPVQIPESSYAPKERGKKTNISYAKPTAPSTDPLPVPWTTVDLIFQNLAKF